MIFTYNKEHVGDVLMVIVKNSGDAKLDVERKGKVTRVFLKDNGETVAWNVFEVSSLFEIAERGQVFLTDEQVARLNQELQAEGFAEDLLQYLKDNDGVCDLGDKSEAEDIKRRFQVSKKVYKRAVGDLYKRHLITVELLAIRLVK